MSVDIYHCLMKALAMDDVEDLTCYPVCASASGAIAELIEVTVIVVVVNVVYLPLEIIISTICRMLMLHLIGLSFCVRL